MFVRPARTDLRIIGYYLSKVIIGLAFVQAIPAAVALVAGEWNDLSALMLGTGLCLTIGFVGEWRLATRRSLTWAHGAVTVALAWLLGALLLAVPLYLSGHFSSMLDAIFDAMSGLTSTGLTLLQDLDHLSYSMNTYRHLMHFAGGQGIVIVVLSLFAAGGARIGTLYISEGRDERILPNFIRTARFIYTVAAVYGLFGTAALAVSLVGTGMPLVDALHHGSNIFFAAFDTGGFNTKSSSIAYYHSVAVEGVVSVLMIAGTLSFGLHYQLWRGQRRELFRHIETRTLAVTLAGLSILGMFGLARSGAYTEAGGLFRKGFFTFLSAQTNTGFVVTSGTLYVTDWGTLAPAAIVGAMGLGGMASSTAGGIKAIRVGITFKALVADVRRLLLPESALVVATYHSQRRRILRDDLVRGATTILLLYVVTYLLGAMVGLFYGEWDVTETLFESVSAASNAGLSIGIASPGMPSVLEVVYMLQMWLGRLEFVAVFAFVGYGVSLLRGRS
jgi:trk system potassium uptake protein TrkH